MPFVVLERFELVWPIARVDRTRDATLVPEAPPQADMSGFRPSDPLPRWPKLRRTRACREPCRV